MTSHRVTLHFHGRSVPARIDCVQSPEEARIDAAIDAWHESDTVLELHEYLGMTEEQYAAFVERCEVPRGPPILQRVEAPAGPGATETADRDGSAVLGGSSPKTHQGAAQAQESVSSHMASSTERIDYALAITAARVCAGFEERTLQAWAERADVSPETLVRGAGMERSVINPALKGGAF